MKSDRRMNDLCLKINTLDGEMTKFSNCRFIRLLVHLSVRSPTQIFEINQFCCKVELERNAAMCRCSIRYKENGQKWDGKKCQYFCSASNSR